MCAAADFELSPVAAGTRSPDTAVTRLSHSLSTSAIDSPLRLKVKTPEIGKTDSREYLSSLVKKHDAKVRPITYVFQQVHECDTAKIVVVHRPGLANRLASLHPTGSLYEKPINLSESLHDHEAFVSFLRKNNMTVYTVEEVLRRDIDQPAQRRALQDLAFVSLVYEYFDEGRDIGRPADEAPSRAALQRGSSAGSAGALKGRPIRRRFGKLLARSSGQPYLLATGTTPISSPAGARKSMAGAAGSSSDDAGDSPTVNLTTENPYGLTPGELYLLSDEYKRSVVAKFDVETLIDIVLTRPTVTLERSDQTSVPLTVRNIAMQPLGNLVFTRDQQIVTARGIVLGNLNVSVRKHEVEVMKFVWQKLGIRIVGRIKEPGCLEGGDFYMAGSDLCLIGVGLRSNMAAVKQMMDGDMLGCRRVAVVKDLYDRNQDRMHLDCVFNFATPKCVCMLDSIIGPESPQRRMVTEWVRGADGRYTVHRDGVEFSQFLAGEGMEIIPVSSEDQLQYALNFVNLGDNKIIAVHQSTAKYLYRSEHFTGDVAVIDYRGITRMYGGAHCSSQICRIAPDESLNTIPSVIQSAKPAARRLDMSALPAYHPAAAAARDKNV